MTTRRPGHCPLDCPDACSLVFEVEGERLVRVRGATDRNPITRGAVCAKVARLADHVYCDDRVRTPLVRVGPKGAGAFAPVSWDEALDRVAAELARVRDAHGGEAILPCSYGGSNGLLTEGSFDARLFARLGASRLRRTLCAMPSSAAHRGLYGRMPGTALQDYAHARLIVVWGSNPHASGIHLLPPILEARRAGARLVVVDPRRIPLAAQADLHLPVRPGSDVVLALALIRWLVHEGHADHAFLAGHATGVDELFRRAEPWTLDAAAEVTGVAASDVETLARWYVAADPAVIRCGYGLERNRNGGSAVAAILAIPAVAGKLGVRGGGFTMSMSGAWALDAAAAADAEQPRTRMVNLSALGPALVAAEPPIRALYVYNGNPLATCPDQEATRRGLLREDLFVVVHDAVMTDTARYADVVLPATTFAEHDELAKGYGALVLERSLPAIPPVGEARDNASVFVALCDRLGLSRPGDARTPADLAERIASQLPPAQAEALRDRGYTPPPVGEAPVPFADVFPATPDRRIHLVPEALDREAGGLYRYRPDPATAEAPLALISPALRDQVSSTFGQLSDAPARVQIHPADAAARGIVDGAPVRLENDLGACEVLAEVTDTVRSGVLCLAKGLWAKHTADGRTANALIPADLTDLGGGGAFNDARVRIVPLG